MSGKKSLLVVFLLSLVLSASLLALPALAGSAPPAPQPAAPAEPSNRPVAPPVPSARPPAVKDGGWTHSGTQDEWAWGLPSYRSVYTEPLTCNPGSPYGCWVTDLAGSYNAASSQDLTSVVITIPLTATVPISVSWYQALYIEGNLYDHAWASYRCNGGAWQQMWVHNSSVSVFQTWQLAPGAPYATACNPGDTLELLFHLDSDTVTEYAGYYLDDVRVFDSQNRTLYAENFEPSAAIDLSLSTKSAPAKVTPGGLFTYTVSLLNQSSSTATNVSLVDPLPLGTTLVSTSTPGTTFSPTLNAVLWNGTVAPMRQMEISFQVRATTTARTITNTATISQPGLAGPVVVSATTEILSPGTFPLCADFEGGVLPSFMFTETTRAGSSTGRARVTGLSPHTGGYALDLDTDLYSGPYTRQAGVLLADLSGQSNVELRFWVRKYWSSSSPLEGVFISDDGGLSYTKIYTFPFTSGYRPVALDLASAAAAAGRTLNNAFLVKFQGYTYDSVPYDGLSLDDICLVTPGPELVYSQKKASLLARPGRIFTYTIAMSNTGGVTATNAMLVDPIPTGTTYIPGSVRGVATYNVAQNQIEWTGTLTPLGIVTASFQVSVTAQAGSITNTATLSHPLLGAAVNLSATTRVVPSLT
ncbi:MAG: DUF11 domain-containing protein, partial [Caldilineae bacterium]